MRSNKKYLLLSLVCIFTLNLSVQGVLEETRKQVISPNSELSFEYYQREVTGKTKQIYYTLSYDGETVLQESEKDIIIENGLFESALSTANDRCKIWNKNIKTKNSTANQT